MQPFTLQPLYKILHVVNVVFSSAEVLYNVEQCWMCGLQTVSKLRVTSITDGFFFNHVISIVKTIVEMNEHTLERLVTY